MSIVNRSLTAVCVQHNLTVFRHITDKLENQIQALSVRDSRTFRTLSLFQDFPGHKNLKK